MTTKIWAFLAAASFMGIVVSYLGFVHSLKTKMQYHYFVSYSYHTPQFTSSGNRSWGSGHCDLKTDCDIATTAGIESCIGYLRDQFIPEHDGPSNSVVIIHWFTTLK